MSEQQDKGRMFFRQSQFEVFDLVIPGIGAIGTAKSEADARRFRACWNACDGVSTVSLEQHGQAGLILDSAITVIGQRDRLLAALEELCDVLGKCGETEMPRALIAECYQSLKAPKLPEESIPGIEVLYVDATPRPTYRRS